MNLKNEVFMTLKNKLLVMLIVSLFSASAFARSPGRELDISDVKTWNEFTEKMKTQEDRDRTDGQAYMISGALLVAGGIIGYHNSQSSVEKLAYSVSQSLGVAGIGYGAYLYNVGSEQTSFHQAVSSSTSLQMEQKDELVRNYVSEWRRNRYNERMIRILTHSIVAGMNFYNASREDQNELKQGLYVIGGVNALAAISLSFDF